MTSNPLGDIPPVPEAAWGAAKMIVATWLDGRVIDGSLLNEFVNELQEAATTARDSPETLILQALASVAVDALQQVEDVDPNGRSALAILDEFIELQLRPATPEDDGPH